MTLKKIRNHQTSTSSSNFNNFRTILKSRINKQAIQQITNLSATLQYSIQQDDKCSVKSSISTHQKSNIQNIATDKLKHFVRNMKHTNFNQTQTSNFKVTSHNDNKDLRDSRASIYSVKSNISKRDNFVSMHKQKDISDNKSIVSTKSLAQPQFTSKSRANILRQTQQNGKEKVLDKLNKMQDKMDYLIKHKLKNLMIRARSKNRFNPKPFLGSGGYSASCIEDQKQDSLLEKQIQNITDAIAAFKQRDSQLQVPCKQIEEDILQLNKKIELLQKVLASNSTQAQIVKKFYFAQKSQKYPHLNRKQNILQQIAKRKQLLKNNYSLLEQKDLNAKASITKYESTTKYFYTKPSKGSYINEPNRLKSFILNRQPMPRSSYDREFLNYGTLPVFNYKPHDSRHSLSKLNVKTSNYQETFKQKHMQMKQINYKQLDCFKNKIKTGNISFAEMYNNKDLKKKKSQKQNTMKREKQNLDNTTSSLQKAMKTLDSLQQQKLSNYKSQTKFFGGTEMKRQYIWHSNLKTEQSQDRQVEQKAYGMNGVIKNGNLINLKATYKMEFLR